MLLCDTRVFSICKGKVAFASALNYSEVTHESYLESEVVRYIKESCEESSKNTVTYFHQF